MKINILGAGTIGDTLGGKWATQGHSVVFGMCDPQAAKVQTMLAQVGQGATAVSVLATVTGADVVVFAIPGRAIAETAGQLGAQLNGKILIDATNNVGQAPMHSLDALRPAAPDSPLFRAFSTLGWENFAQPVIDGVPVDLFYCEDRDAAQTAVDHLIAEVGLRPVYIGDATQADKLDGLTRLWFALARQQGRGRRLTFKLMGG